MKRTREVLQKRLTRGKTDIYRERKRERGRERERERRNHFCGVNEARCRVSAHCRITTTCGSFARLLLSLRSAK